MMEYAWKYYNDTKIIPDLELYRENAKFSKDEFSEIGSTYNLISNNAQEFINYCRNHIKSKKEDMSKLYIIGNGFDLKHNIPSRYSDFAKFVITCDPSLFEQIEKCLRNLSLNGLWSNFEAALGTQNYNELLKDIKRNIEIKKDYPIGIDFSSLKICFRDWVIALKKYLCVSCSRKYALEKDAYFLSFNYTDTLETIYNISKAHICHIHGYVDKGDLDIEATYAGYIVGHDNKEYENEIDGFTSDPYEQQELKDVISGYKKDHNLSEIEQFVGKIPHESISDIVVLGHSLGLIDAPYFEMINKEFPNIYWQIGYFDERDYVCKVNSLVKIGVKNYFLFEDR